MISNNDKDRRLLFRAMRTSYAAVAPDRKIRYKLIGQYLNRVNRQFGSVPHDKQRDTVNLLRQYVEAYVTDMVAQRPRVMVNTRDSMLRPFATRFEMSLNRYSDEIHLEQPLRSAVIAAFFGMGIVNVSRSRLAPWFAKTLGRDVNAAYPDILPVSFDDYVFDASAKRWRDMFYEGHGYRCRYDTLHGENYDQSAVKKLNPTSKYQPMNQLGEPLTRNFTFESDPEEPVEMVDLLDVFVPDDNRVYTFAPSGPMKFNDDAPLISSFEWDGHPDGPYPKLLFSESPENLLVGGPLEHLQNLASLINSLIHDQAQRARAAKNVTLFEPSAKDDADRIRRAMEGEFIASSSPEKIHAFKLGGADPGTQLFSDWAQKTFDRMGGNIQARAGLGPQSETAHQDELIHQQVSRSEAFLAGKLASFTAECCQRLGWLIWNDLKIVIPQEYKIQNTDITVPMHWTPQNRLGTLHDYDITIDPFSMQYQSPSQMLQGSLQFLQSFVLPMWPMFQQQGAQFDCRKIVDDFADMSNNPRTREWIRFQGKSYDREQAAGQPGVGQDGEAGQDGQQGPVGGQIPGQPRKYIRMGRSANPQGAQDNQMQNALAQMAGQSQERQWGHE